MCIFFLYVNNDAAGDDFQIIAALNRDEFLNRPTAPAQFWNESSCISGIDMEPGREGGTWFGASTAGKVGALLNISEKDPLCNKRGRGHLVTDFLTMNLRASEFAAKVSAEEEHYNGFNLVLLEKCAGQWVVHYTSNRTEQKPACSQLSLPSDGVLAWSNSTQDKPWRKVVEGQRRFAEIVGGAAAATSDELKQQLFTLLSDKTSRLPDAQLESTSAVNNPVVLAARSAICVDLATVGQYATRTQTVLLIDALGKSEFTERTMKEPIDCSSPIWETTKHAYYLVDSIVDSKSKC